jgi:RHS repeat-associated protein
VVNTTAVPNVELFAGERFDSNLGLYYNRARWMDPRAGRFASIDPYSGSMLRPITLHDYAYAGLNPISQLDPTGKFTMSDISGGLGSAINISSRAVSFYDTFISPFVEDDDSDLPTLWDGLMNAALGGGSSLASAAFGFVAPGAKTTTGLTERHHLIPVYLCGRDSAANLYPVRTPSHHNLHGQLDQMTLAIEAAGAVITLVLSRGKAKKNLPTLQKYLKKSGNRAVVVGSLHFFYDYYGFTNDRGFEAAFVAEGGRYVQSKAFTSLPTCRK